MCDEITNFMDNLSTNVTNSIPTNVKNTVSINSEENNCFIHTNSLLTTIPLVIIYSFLLLLFLSVVITIIQYIE